MNTFQDSANAMESWQRTNEIKLIKAINNHKRGSLFLRIDEGAEIAKYEKKERTIVLIIFFRDLLQNDDLFFIPFRL